MDKVDVYVLWQHQEEICQSSRLCNVAPTNLIVLILNSKSSCYATLENRAFSEGQILDISGKKSLVIIRILPFVGVDWCILDPAQNFRNH